MRGYTEAELVKKNCKHLVLRRFTFLIEEMSLRVTQQRTSLDFASVFECDGTPNFECHCDRTFGLNAAEIHQIHQDEIQWQR